MGSRAKKKKPVLIITDSRIRIERDSFFLVSNSHFLTGRKSYNNVREKKLTHYGCGYLRSAIINYLRTAGNRWVSLEELAEFIYTRKSDGGALTAVNSIRRAIWKMRKINLFPLETKRGFGVRYIWSEWEIPHD